MKLLKHHSFDRFRNAALRVEDIKLWKMYYATGVVQIDCWVHGVMFTRLPYTESSSDCSFLKDILWVSHLLFRPRTQQRVENPYHGKASVSDMGLVKNTYNDHLVFADENLAKEYVTSAWKYLEVKS